MPDAPVAPRPAAWSDGWYRFAHVCHSPNFGPRPPHASIDLVVIHSISLPPGQFGGECITQLFTNRLDWDAHPYFQSIRGLQVSAHFVIRRNGDLWQYVSCDDRAWHAGVSHYRGRDNCNDDSVGIELEGIEGGAFEPAQYETLTTLLSDVALHYPIAHVAGHEHVAPGRKRDPGNGFDWAALQRASGMATRCFPEGVAVG